MQERLDARLQHKLVGHYLEQLRVERLAVRLRFGLRGAGIARPLLELDAEALRVDGALVAVPGDGLDADLGDRSAEAAVAVDQRRARAGSRGGDRRREPSRPAADDEDVRLAQDGRRLRRLCDVLRLLPHGACEAPLSGVA